MKNKKLVSKLTAFCTAVVLGVTAIAASATPVSVNAATTVAINKTNFPDANFRSALKTYYDENNDDKLSSTELKAIKQLCLSGYGDKSYNQKGYFYGVKNVKGVEKLTSLTELDAFGDTKTQKLDLSKLKSLKKVYIFGFEKLTALNVKGLTKLESLNVSGCAKFKTLDVTSNSGLKEVCCSSCPKFTTLKTGSQNKKLSGLYVYNEAVSKLDVSKLGALKEVDISNTSLSIDKIGIKNKSKITSLTVSNAKKNAGVDYAKYPNLTDLAANGVGLKTIDLSANTKLKNLYLNDNDLSKLDLSKQTALEQIGVGSNKNLKTLDISYAGQIQYIYVGKGIQVILPKGEYVNTIYSYDYDSETGEYNEKIEEISISSEIDTAKDMPGTSYLNLIEKQSGKEITLYADEY